MFDIFVKNLKYKIIKRIIKICYKKGDKDG